MSNQLQVIDNNKLQIYERGSYLAPNTTIEEAADMLLGLDRIRDVTQWAKIDLLVEARRRWGDDYAQVFNDQYSLRSITNLARVHRYFPTMGSRKWDLTFSHYRAVANDTLNDEERVMLLEEAIEHGLGSDAFSRHVQEYKAERDGVEEEVRFNAFHFAVNVRALYNWARSNGAPADLLENVEPMLLTYEEKHPEI